LKRAESPLYSLRKTAIKNRRFEGARRKFNLLNAASAAEGIFPPRNQLFSAVSLAAKGMFQPQEDFTRHKSPNSLKRSY
jgi:hypothetical protein